MTLKWEVEPTIRLMPQTVPLDIASLGERNTLKQRNFGACSQNFSTSAVSNSQDRLNERWDVDVAPHLRGLYLSFDTDQRPERLDDAFPGQTLTRLQLLKARYNPDNIFNQNFAIPPATDVSRPEAATAGSRTGG
jgi:hypothetical protein